MKYHLKPQPFPLIVGESLDNLSHIFVWIDGRKYKVDTVIKAVDLCFKLFFATHTNYPKESEAAWIFLQWYVFKIKTKYDKKYVSVSTLISEIEKRRENQQNL